MRKVIKVATTFVMSAICIGAFPLCGQAGINVRDSDIILETEDETYIVTGSAVRAEDICGVKELIDSIGYPDMESDIENSKTNTSPPESNRNSNGMSEESADENLNSETEHDIYPGEDVVELVNLKGDTTTVYKLIDGRYMDRMDRIFIFDGVDTWIDEEGVEWNETVK